MFKSLLVVIIALGLIILAVGYLSKHEEVATQVGADSRSLCEKVKTVFKYIVNGFKKPETANTPKE